MKRTMLIKPTLSITLALSILLSGAGIAQEKVVEAEEMAFFHITLSSKQADEISSIILEKMYQMVVNGYLGAYIEISNKNKILYGYPRNIETAVNLIKDLGGKDIIEKADYISPKHQEEVTTEERKKPSLDEILGTKSYISFKNVSLFDIIVGISTTYDINIAFDSEVLSKLDIDNLKITIEERQIALEEALARILLPCGLNYKLADDTVVVILKSSNSPKVGL